MIDILNTIYNFAEPVRARKGSCAVSELVAIRRVKLLTMTKYKPMKTAEISRKLKAEVSLIRSDIRKLITEGKLINLSRDKEYYVKAA